MSGQSARLLLYRKTNASTSYTEGSKQLCGFQRQETTRMTRARKGRKQLQGPLLGKGPFTISILFWCAYFILFLCVPLFPFAFPSCTFMYSCASLLLSCLFLSFLFHFINALVSKHSCYQSDKSKVVISCILCSPFFARFSHISPHFMALYRRGIVSS